MNFNNNSMSGIAFADNPIIVSLSIGSNEFPDNVEECKCTIFVKVDGFEQAFKYETLTFNGDTIEQDVSSAFEPALTASVRTPEDYLNPVAAENKSGNQTKFTESAITGEISAQLAYVKSNDTGWTSMNKVSGGVVHVFRGGFSEYMIEQTAYKKNNATVTPSNVLDNYGKLSTKPTSPEVINVGDYHMASVVDKVNQKIHTKTEKVTKLSAQEVSDLFGTPTKVQTVYEIDLLKKGTWVASGVLPEDVTLNLVFKGSTETAQVPVTLPKGKSEGMFFSGTTIDAEGNATTEFKVQGTGKVDDKVVLYIFGKRYWWSDQPLPWHIKLQDVAQNGSRKDIVLGEKLSSGTIDCSGTLKCLQWSVDGYSWTNFTSHNAISTTPHMHENITADDSKKYSLQIALADLKDMAAIKSQYGDGVLQPLRVVWKNRIRYNVYIEGLDADVCKTSAAAQDRINKSKQNISLRKCTSKTILASVDGAGKMIVSEPLPDDVTLDITVNEKLEGESSFEERKHTIVCKKGEFDIDMDWRPRVVHLYKDNNEWKWKSNLPMLQDELVELRYNTVITTATLWKGKSECSLFGIVLAVEVDSDGYLKLCRHHKGEHEYGIVTPYKLVVHYFNNSTHASDTRIIKEDNSRSSSPVNGDVTITGICAPDLYGSDSPAQDVLPIGSYTVVTSVDKANELASQWTSAKGLSDEYIRYCRIVGSTGVYTPNWSSIEWNVGNIEIASAAQGIKISKVIYLPDIRTICTSYVGDTSETYSSVYVEDNPRRHQFFFVNSLGCMESASALFLETAKSKISSTTYTLTKNPSYRPTASVYMKKEDEPMSWEMSSGFVPIDWAAWWASEFCKAKRYWMRLESGMIIPVSVKFKDDSVEVYNLSNGSLSEVKFTVTAGIKGWIDL